MMKEVRKTAQKKLTLRGGLSEGEEEVDGDLPRLAGGGARPLFRISTTMYISNNMPSETKRTWI